jgi:hypothetical protein
VTTDEMYNKLLRVEKNDLIGMLIAWIEMFIPEENHEKLFNDIMSGRYKL